MKQILLITLVLLLIAAIWLLATSRICNTLQGVKQVTRTYYIAADEIDWDYAPTGKDQMTGRDFDSVQSEYAAPSSKRIGRVYKKAIYREYTDSSFTQLKPREEKWEHLGLLGPVIRAQVGDTLHIVFRNNSKLHAYSIHPHGVFYAPGSEGVMDSTRGIASPGATINYTWPVPERAGPGPDDGSSIVWPYHSHADEPRDVNSGLIGAILVTAAGKARADGSPIDVDREFVALFTIFNENQSWYLDENIRRAGKPELIHRDDPEFQESNLKHSINGYLYSNLPGLEMKQGERVRWYLMGMGTEADIHTPHWHGNTVLISGHRADVAQLLPATVVVTDMIPDNPGQWMFHCHVNDHMIAGMTAEYVVDPAHGIPPGKNFVCF